MRTWMMRAMAVVLLVPSMAAARQAGVMIYGEGDPSQPAVWAVGGDDESMVMLGGRKAYLGVDVADVTADRMSALKLKEERGVEVRLVDQDAPAGKSGLKVGDVILDFNGQRVESAEALRRMIHETPPGRSVKLGISREGQPMTLTATLGDRSKMYAKKYKMVMPKMPKVPAMEVMVRTSVARNGLVVENLTNQLGDFFGVKDGAGVLVRSVEKGSPAEASGFRAGDVIVSVGSEKIADTGDWRSAMRRQKSGALSVGIIREKKTQTLTLNLPERRGNDDSSMLRFDLPEFDLDFDMDDFRQDMDELRLEMEKIKPEVERVRREARTQAAQAREQAVQVLRLSRADVQRSMEQAKREMRRQIEEQRRVIEQQKRELKRQMSEIL
ncbi:MAG TPA: PDZ domain-containing protein [Terriglobales bacterium]|nr:PDZ domain-containing protein [Terriglobales bacterium]